MQVKAVQSQLGFPTAAGQTAEAQACPQSAAPDDSYPQVATVDSFQARVRDLH